VSCFLFGRRFGFAAGLGFVPTSTIFGSAR
jgi:hypothetical protein